MRSLAAAGMLRIQSNLREEGGEGIGLNWIIGTATSKHLRQGSNSHGMLVMLAHNKSAGSAEDAKKRKGAEKGAEKASRFDNRAAHLAL